MSHIGIKLALSLPFGAMTTATLKRTAFHKYHLEHKAKMVDFTGWDMPLLYSSIIEEHKQVRRSGGLFDVSHMGRIRFKGKDARRFLDRVCTRQILGMTDGQASYSLVCNENGGCRDDVLVYRISDFEYLMVCNASNREKLVQHFEAERGDMVFKMKDETLSTAMVAIQGPKVMDVIGQFSREVPTLKRYHFTQKQLLLFKMLFSRTGYTGEDGVEVIMPAKMASKAVDLLMMKLGGKYDIVRPTGLGARDSLRLEAGMALYGHEITEDIDPLSAGLNFAVKLDKGESAPEAGRFIGQDALQRIAAEGPSRKLKGLVLEGRRSARQGMSVLHDGKAVGEVTSGCLSPTLDQSIAMAYIPANIAVAGTHVAVDLGRATVNAEVVDLPFYKRPS
ncbi:MAG: glycine cleavage system aminomethyltransferase GcvT [Phycisphaerales bacterium]|nr:glycine cleavage system aminomethyltransferase GcvT [Phycisphaerales bacterium]